MSTRDNLFSTIRIIGFDLDQTLYPKSPLIDEKIQEYLYQKIAEHHHTSLEEAEKLFKERYQGGAGMSGRQTLEDLDLPNASETVQEALERADIASILTPDESINQLLSEISVRYDGLDLITGSDYEQTRKKIGALAIRPELFSHIITTNDASKSTGEAYRLWLSYYPHIKPEKFLYVGDRMKSDHEVPSGLGIQTALVYTPQTILKPPFQFVSLKEFLRIL